MTSREWFIVPKRDISRYKRAIGIDDVVSKVYLNTLHKKTIGFRLKKWINKNEKSLEQVLKEKNKINNLQ